MDCRIQVLERRGIRTVTVAGQLGCAHVADLLEACGELSPALQLDLTDVVSADAIAVEALRRIRKAGARLVGIPRYIMLKLDSLNGNPPGL